MLEVKAPVKYTNPKAGTTVSAIVEKLGSSRVGIVIDGDNKIKWVERHNVQPATPPAIEPDPKRPSRGSLMFSTAQVAATFVKVEDFKPVYPARIKSRRELLSEKHVYLMAFWGKHSLSLRSNGELWMVTGQIATEVRASAGVLETIFALHKKVEWWKR